MNSENATVRVDFKILPHGIPFYGEPENPKSFPAPATPGSAAFDLYSMDDVLIEPGQCLPVSTGIAVHILQPNVCGIVVPRSGLGAKSGVVLGNSLGLIDNDYQGELICYIWNRNFWSDTLGKLPPRLHITPGMKFAQMFFTPFLSPMFRRVTEFSTETARGTGGFGSTGS